MPASPVRAVDSDGDGLPDEFEMLIGLDPADPADAAQDKDRDGLLAAEEASAGTDQHDSDTDLGGESDGSEVRAGRDPLNRDDDAAPFLYSWVRPLDGFLIEVGAFTEDQSGRIVVFRATPETVVVVGVIPGEGGILADGPLESDEYAYFMIAVTADGATSGVSWEGDLLTPKADVTPPFVLISVNGGTWRTTEREVSVVFFDLSEPVVEMRLAASEEDLQTAEWVPFALETTFVVPDVPGIHIVHAQVRDAAGRASSPATGVVDYEPDAD